MRADGLTIDNIAKLLSVAKSTISNWVRDIVPNEDNLLNNKNAALLKREILRAEKYRNLRIDAQRKGASRVLKENPRYLAGCMLYWGEGSKQVNSLKITNSSLSLMKVFKNFLIEFFDVEHSNILLTINCYDDFHSVEDIENYWLNGLSLTKDSLRKGNTNQNPISSKNLKKGKLEWGVAAMLVHNTYIVQEILGAIQAFGSFEEKEWLK